MKFGEALEEVKKGALIARADGMVKECSYSSDRKIGCLLI